MGIFRIFATKTETRMISERKEYKYGISDWKSHIGKSVRTEGAILLFCEEGMAVVSVEFKQQVVRKGDIVLIFYDTMFVVNEVSRTFRHRYIEISSELFDVATLTLTSQFLEMIYDAPVFHTTPEQWDLLMTWEKQFLWIAQNTTQKSAFLMSRNQIQNFFIGLESIVMSENISTRIQPISSVRQLFNRFCRLLAEHCRTQHEVKFYADKLCITPYYLSKVTDKTTGMPPKELIDRQIIMEMKLLLATTNTPIKELAVQFNFDTVSYMARYFRRHTGLTPNEFRKQ